MTERQYEAAYVYEVPYTTVTTKTCKKWHIVDDGIEHYIGNDKYGDPTRVVTYLRAKGIPVVESMGEEMSSVAMLPENVRAAEKTLGGYQSKEGRVAVGNYGNATIRTFHSVGKERHLERCAVLEKELTDAGIKFTKECSTVHGDRACKLAYTGAQ